MTPDDVAGLANIDARTRDEVLDVAFAEYDRTRPILDGRVRPEGLKLNLRTGWIGEFCVKPVYEEFDVAEMSLSWFIAAKARNEPCVALPVFPLRMAVLGYMFVRSDSPIEHPSQLVGKTIATTGYRYTVNLWLRGMLKEHYGLAPEQAKWVTSEPETNNYVLPKGIQRTIRKDKTVGQLLIDGEVDAVIGPEAPDEFHKGDPRIRRLFRDARAEQAAYFKKTGIYPITHTVVMKERIARERPEVAEKFVKCFRDAQVMCTEFYYKNAKHMSFPSGPFILEEEKALYGAEPYANGMEETRVVIETFIRYAYEQQYIDRILKLEEIYPPNTYKL